MRSYSCAALASIAHCAEASPHSDALVRPDGITLSYNDLWTQIEAVSRRLQHAGVGSGERVAVLVPQGALQILAVVGVLNQHVAIPLQAKTTAAEVEFSLRRMSASALIVSPEYVAETEAATQMGLTVLVARKEALPSAWEIRASAVAPTRSASGSKAILFLITSATTDRSKVVPLTGANLDAGNAATRDAAQLAGSDRLLSMVSLCHRLGLESVLAQFLAGGTVIATPGFDPAAFGRWLIDLKPTWYVCAPTVHQAALAQLKTAPPNDPTSLRLVQSAGAPLPKDVRDELEQLLSVPVLNGYGATEAHYIAIEALPFEGHIPAAAGRSCGLEIGIVHASGEVLPTGEEGEIVVRGPAVFSGYEDDAEANRRAFQNGWFRTGDLGRLDAQGNLFITGRLKEMINRGGEKIVPGEVDEVFASHPAVLEAAAFAVPHPTLGEDVACAIVLHEGHELRVSPRELRSYAAQRLAPFKVPHRIHFVDQIPRGELGKPQRWVLSERLRHDRNGGPTPAEVNRHPLAGGLLFRSLHEIWARVLDRPDLGYDEDFFEAGGDSLAAINMLAEVDQRYGCQTSAWAASFLDEPTLENLTRLMGNPLPPRPSRNDSSNMQIFPVRKGGASAELFCIPTEGHEGLYFRRLASHLAGKMDLSIVRPANTFHNIGLFSLEREGKEVAEVIRRAQSEGPYFVSGYCYGGVVAVEAARQLALEGQDVRVILFEVPTPGSPGILRDWRIWIEGGKRQWRRIWTTKHPGLTRNVRRFMLRALWAVLVSFRSLLVPIEHLALIQWILTWAQFENFPLYKARVIDAPLLHFLCMDEPSLIDSASRFGWRRIAGRGLEERFVPLNHQTILLEPNLPEIVDVLLRWCGIQEGRGSETIPDLASMDTVLKPDNAVFPGVEG